jgi:hypothetical protein
MSYHPRLFCCVLQRACVPYVCTVEVTLNVRNLFERHDVAGGAFLSDTATTNYMTVQRNVRNWCRRSNTAGNCRQGLSGNKHDERQWPEPCDDGSRWQLLCDSPGQFRQHQTNGKRLRSQRVYRQRQLAWLHCECEPTVGWQVPECSHCHGRTVCSRLQQCLLCKLHCLRFDGCFEVIVLWTRLSRKQNNISRRLSAELANLHKSYPNAGRATRWQNRGGYSIYVAASSIANPFSPFELTVFPNRECASTSSLQVPRRIGRV